MSGGRFYYRDDAIGEIASEIERLIQSNDSTETNEYGERSGHGYSAQTIAKFKHAVDLLRLAQMYAHRVDWLVSGDDSEESFHERLAEDLDEFSRKMIGLNGEEMTNDEIMEMACEAGIEWRNELRHFADLVANNEREACAVIAEKTVCDTHIPTGIKIYGTRAAKSIRARCKP